MASIHMAFNKSEILLTQPTGQKGKSRSLGGALKLNMVLLRIKFCSLAT